MGPHDIQTWTQQIDVLKAFLNKDILRFDLLGYKKEKESEWLYRINGCAHTEQQIQNGQSRIQRKSWFHPKKKVDIVRKLLKVND